MEEGEWYYDAKPLFSLQKTVDGIDWISEAYIYGGYARALLGYPPFPEPKFNGEPREKFGPGHDIDIGFKVDPEKTLRAFDDFRRTNPDIWDKHSFERSGYMSKDEFLDKTKERIKRGMLPDIVTLILETKYGQKLGPYWLSWTGMDIEAGVPLISPADFKPGIRIKPKPIKIGNELRKAEAAGSNPARAGSNPAVIPYWAIPTAFTLILIGVSFAGWVATQLEGEA